MTCKRFQGDLVKNGGTPAFTEPLHVGRPNICDRSRYMDLIEQMLDRRWLSNNGPLVQEFEREIARFLGVRNVVAVCNGTIALEIAVRALELNGEVIVPSYTFIATAHAVHWQGLTPVFVDIDPATHCIDPAAVERAITPRTTGVLAVHLWGCPAPVEALQRICNERHLALLFDAAHAFGVSKGNSLIGRNGQCEVFSFHATKFLNSLEGGAVTTDDDELAEKMRLIRNFGFKGFDNVIHPGTNGKMVEACAAMGLVNLASVDRIVEANRKNYQAYRSGLADIPGLRLFAFDESQRNNWQYVVVEVDPEFGVARDDVVATLHMENILARRYFWPGAHRMSPYRELYPWVDQLVPITNDVASRVIVLPTGTAVSPEDVDVVTSIFRVLHESAA
jgi:dTDP-4-amino-4,6-dideoxygalactose transaminase